MTKRKSIVLVTVDCLRADHVGFMGYRRPTTPFLDSLAQGSFAIPTAIVAGAPTYYSFPAILASRYPLALGRDVLGLAPDEPSLATVLQEAGYATAAFGAGNPYVGSRFGYAQGFDVFRDFLQDFVPPHVEEAEQEKRARGWASRLNRRLIKMRPKMGPFARVYDELYFRYCQQVTPVPASLDAQRCFPSADILVGEAKEWLASTGDEPFFLWIHLMDPHAPYFPKDEALALMGDSLLSPERARYLNSFWHRYDLGPRRLATHRSEIIRLYDAGIRWVDAQVERLIEHLRKAGKWRDCIFALTADHGEEFLEHGGRLHPPAGLMEELIHVPLLLRVPECAKKEVAKGPFSMLHLAPTLLDAAELPIPSSFEGRSHWPQLREGAPFEGIAISECVAGCTNPFRLENRMGARVLSVREARYKLVLHFAPPAEHLYDLDADPEEKTPLGAGEQKPLRKRLLEIARAHLNASTAHRDLRLRSRAQLRDLQLEWKNPAGKPSLVAS